MNLEQVLEFTKQVAKEAGDIQKKHFRSKNISMYLKSSDVDLVTKVDKASEYFIIKKLSEKYDFSFLSEEKGVIENNSEYRWIIDPLDGTTNYANGFPIFGISIALEKNDETILGVIYIPLLDEMYTAIKDRGAFLNGKELNVSRKDSLKESVLATGFPYDRAETSDNNANYFSNFVPKVRGLRRSGSAAFDLANIASGVLDGFWELNLSPWDVKAGILLIKEAGGIVKEINDKRGISIIAGNQLIVQLINLELKDVDKND